MPPDDPAALADALESAVGAEDFSALRDAAHRTIRERFDVTRTVRPIKAVFERHATPG